MLGAARVAVRVFERRAEVDAADGASVASHEAADVSLEGGGARPEESVVRLEETEAPRALATDFGGAAR
jgi:hypothetical protein